MTETLITYPGYLLFMPRKKTGHLAYLAGAEDIELQEYEVPSAEPGSIVAEIIRANVCGSELHIWGGHHPVLNEAVLGHEALCEVVELGEGVNEDYAGQPISEGDIIAPVYFQTCRKCRYCRKGEFYQCEKVYDHWLNPPEESPHFHGTFGTHYYIHPDQYFYKVPETVDSGVAASANCALSQILFGIDEINLSHGESVVIQGAGGLGLNAIAVARECGATPIVVEGVDSRIELAEEFGAEHVINFNEYDTVEKREERVKELTGGLGADVGIEVAGVPPAFAEGTHLIRNGGRYLTMGNINPGKETEVDPGMLTRKSIDIVPRVRYQPWYLHNALTFLENHADEYPFEKLLDSTFALEDVDDAMEQSRGREVTRASLTPQEK